ADLPQLVALLAGGLPLRAIAHGDPLRRTDQPAGGQEKVMLLLQSGAVAYRPRKNRSEPGIGAAQRGAIQVLLASQALAIELVALRTLQGDRREKEVVEADKGGPHFTVTQCFGGAGDGEPGFAGGGEPQRLGNRKKAAAGAFHSQGQPFLAQQARLSFEVLYPGDSLPRADRPAGCRQMGFHPGTQLLEQARRRRMGKTTAQPVEPGVDPPGKILSGR